METLHDIVNKYKQIGTPESILDYIRKVTPKWFSSPWEKMGAIPINASGYPLGVEFMSEGSENTCQLCTRKLFKLIFSKRKYASATGFVLVHNHPSGRVDPSPEDGSVTRALLGAGKLLDFQMLDHIIISPLDKLYSFRRFNDDWWDNH